MQDFKAQFNKGVLELVILHLLTESSQYGYSLIQSLRTRSKENIIVKDGTLYPILYRLEDQAFIESFWETTEDRSTKPRKYYRITDKGMNRYRKMLEDYHQVQDGINQIIRKGSSNENR
jgi:PadR family transcriptional regulator PadR